MSLPLFDTPALPPHSLDDGAVLLRGWAAAQDDAWVAAVRSVAAQAAFRTMVRPGGAALSVAMTNCGDWGWVSDVQRYSYSSTDPRTGLPWPAMPAFMFEQAVAAAQAAGYGGYAPDACLVNRYQPGAKLTLHRDEDEMDWSAPIVSVSLGLPCTFLWGGLTRQSPVRRLPLTHGDVLVWGGATRMAYHGVNPLKDGRHHLLGAERWNLTFRMAKRYYHGAAAPAAAH